MAITVNEGFFTMAEFVTFSAMTHAMGLVKDPEVVADMIGSLGGPRVALNAMADRFASEWPAEQSTAHTLAYGPHSKAQCGEWCEFAADDAHDTEVM